jgi:beta-galactosidase
MTPRYPGSRLGWCPSSPVFRELALGITAALAERYGKHPAVKLWHLGNELGGGNARCYCAVSAEAFRSWLREHHGTVDAVNAAWGTAFWGHLYGSFEQIMPPRDPEQGANPGLVLDYLRFSSDELLSHVRDGAAIIRAHSTTPLTTNLMVSSRGHVAAYETWTPSVDLVSNDHYTLVDDPDRAIELALSDDRMRGLSGRDRPWMLMEHSTGGPSWQQRNRAKDPGEIARNALTHVARGSDSVMFFQWRASVSGAEQFHSAMLPHAGTETRVFREIEELGAALRRLEVVQGSPVEPARVALLMDEESAWVYEHGLKPHRALRSSHEPLQWYRAFWNRQVPLDVLPADAALDDYDVVIVPSVFIADEARAGRIAGVVARGGTVLVTYLSGIVDRNNRVISGGYPGAFRDLLGVWTEEFRPLQAYESVGLSDGTRIVDWTEDTVLVDAKAVITFADGPSAGRAAVTRRSLRDGNAWYIAASLASTTVQSIVDTIIDESGLDRTIVATEGVEAIRRLTSEGPVLFIINHTDSAVSVATRGIELLTGITVADPLEVPAGAVAAVLETSAA